MSEKRSPALPILLVDDEDAWLHRLAFTLEYEAGFNNILQCQDGRQVLEIMGRQPVGVVLLDLTMPHIGGEDVLASVAAEHPEVPVIILSGLNQLTTAVRCIKSGAFDYFVKTDEKERLLKGIDRALEMRELQQEHQDLKGRFLDGHLSNPDVFAEIHTEDPRMRSVFQYLEMTARSSEPVLITGESGVGKELIAQAVHRLRRPKGPFVALNVAGLDDNVFSDTLFGHSRGAFTSASHDRAGMIEKAVGGILFLDEIGDLSSASQVKLLRFLQEGEYLPLGSDTPRRADVQIVFATNQDLEKRQAAGEFRKDLYYRLCAHLVHIPPLRERKADIPLLLDHFLREAAATLKVKVPRYPKELLLLLSAYAFPGNVRQLRAMVFDALSAHRGGLLSLRSFRKTIERGHEGLVESSSTAAERASVFSDLAELPSLAEVADLLVEEAMRRAKSNQSIAAGLLGISRQALNKRLKNKKN